MTADIYYWGHIDRDPEQTKRKVLVALASTSAPQRRRAIQGQVFGDKYGASQTIDALRWLEDHRLAERSRYDSRKWSITAAGRVALDMAAAMDESA